MSNLNSNLRQFSNAIDLLAEGIIRKHENEMGDKADSSDVHGIIAVLIRAAGDWAECALANDSCDPATRELIAAHNLEP